MDLPTYTNIWRIEKRLYKLYDLRLPMPLPIVWIGVFVGVFVPWSLLLVLVGVPVAMPWHVLFLVPPGIVTWMSTRPVIEGKRLTELLESQLRYLGQPRAWYRLAPAAEPETITFSGRVWHTGPARVKVRKAGKARAAQVRKASKSAAGQAAGQAAGPRQVRPAVAAAAAAATQAPLAGSAAGRPPGTAARRGAAPALSTAAAAPGNDLPALPASRHAEGAAGHRAEPAPATGVRDDAGANGATVRGASGARGDAPRDDSGARGGDGAAGSAARGGLSPLRWGELPLVSRRDDHDVQRATHPAPDQSAERPDQVVGREDWSPERSDRVVERPDQVVGRDDRSPERSDRVVESDQSAERPDRAPERDDRSAPVTGKPIDTEALRRLRRLAASADPRPSGGAVADEAAVGGAVGDEAAVGGVLGDEVAVGGTVADEAAVGGAAVGEASAEREQVEAGVPAEETPAQGAASDPSPAVTSTPAETARMQHRKGQPPRQVPLLPGAESVWPSLSPGARPVRLQPLRGSGEAPLRGRDEPPTGARETLRPVQTPAPGEQATAAPTARPDGPAERGGTAEEADDQTTGREARTGQEAGREVRVRRVESVVGRDSGGWRRIAQVVVGGGGVRTDGSEIDEARARGVFPGSRRVVVLGCTGGAGQSTTALMLGHTLAGHRDDKVIAVDASTGRDTLTSRIVLETPETLTSLLSGLDQVSGYLSMRGFTSRTPTGLEVIGSDADDEAERRLSDRTLLSDHRLGQVMHLLDRHYKLAVVDPAAALAARVLPYADQLVLVVPASEEAAEAVAMTYEWLDGHGCGDLRRRAVMVVNGVSRRSMADVEQAEAVARGRCRAIVRVPWEDDLAPGGADVVDPGQLRAAGRRAYLALAGVVVAGFAAQAVRASEEELASDPPGTRIGER